jgi:hypothetical protein
MKINRFVLSFLILAIVVLGSMLLSKYRQDAAAKLPYTVGSAVLPATSLPPGMALKTFEVSAAEPVPTVSFEITKDTMGGWDVHVDTTNFTYSPEHLNGAPVPGEGHVHLYIDDNLIIMLAPWYHIDSLSPGAHTIRAGLFNNDHSAYTINGQRVEATQTVDVPASGAMQMPGMNMN